MRSIQLSRGARIILHIPLLGDTPGQPLQSCHTLGEMPLQRTRRGLNRRLHRDSRRIPGGFGFAAMLTSVVAMSTFRT